MKKTLVISAFPGTGKTWFVNNSQLNCLDSDSSSFDKRYFPENYINHIVDNIGRVDLIFVSSHISVRKELINRKIEFVAVYPFMYCKREYKERFSGRGSEWQFIQTIMDNWQYWIEEMQETKPHPVIWLSAGKFISDIFMLNSDIQSNGVSQQAMLS